MKCHNRAHAVNNICSYFTPEVEPPVSSTTTSRVDAVNTKLSSNPAAASSTQLKAGRKQQNPTASSTDVDAQRDDALLDEISASLDSLHASGQAMSDHNDGVDALIGSVDAAQQHMKHNERKAQRF